MRYVGLIAFIFAQLSCLLASNDPFSGSWAGWAVAGEDRAEVALDITPAAEGEWAAHLTLPFGHILKMPVGPLKRDAEGTGALVGKQVKVRSDSKGLTGEIPHASVRLELHRDRVISPAAEPELGKAAPAPLWSTQLDAPLWAEPAVHNDVAYVGTEKGEVIAIGLDEGSVRWRRLTGSAVYSAPFVHDGHVFVLNDAPELLSLSASTGEVEWRVKLADAPSPRVLPAQDKFDFDYKAPVPAVFEEAIYVGTGDGVIHKLDADMGSIVWQTTLSSKVRTTALHTQHGVVIATADGTLVQLDRQDGSTRWTVQPGGELNAGPTYVDGRIVVGSRNAHLYAFSEDKGELLWKRFQWFSWVESTPLAIADAFVVGSSDNRAVRKLSAATGDTHWHTPVAGWAWASPAEHDGVVYFTTAGTGADYAMKPQPLGSVGALETATGQVLWTEVMPTAAQGYLSGFVAGPIVADGRLIVAGLDGTLRAYPLK